MPKQSQREILTEELLNLARIELLAHALNPDIPTSSSSVSSNPEDDFFDSHMFSDVLETTLPSSDYNAPDFPTEQAFVLLVSAAALQSHRYLNPRTSIKKTPSQLHLLLRNYRANNPRLFRKLLRVTPHTFDALVELIQGDKTFHNNSHNQQAPVAEQLAVALYRFGHFGNAAGLEEVGLWSGFSYGTVDNCTRRVLEALRRPEIRAACIHWPSEDEKEAAREAVEDIVCEGWRDGWCMVDGTLVPLYSRPHHFGSTWFDRKSNYSMNVQVCSILLVNVILISNS